MSGQLSHADRKALLIARSDLDRMRFRLAIHTMRSIVSPPVSEARSQWARPYVATVLSYALPVLGARRLARLVRVLSAALVTYRAVSSWRRKS